MICILHGYLLDGSGSNLWTQSIIRTLCRAGETVHLMCQEPHPEKFDYVARAVRYDAQLEPELADDQYGGRECHRPRYGPPDGDTGPTGDEPHDGERRNDGKNRKGETPEEALFDRRVEK